MKKLLQLFAIIGALIFTLNVTNLHALADNEDVSGDTSTSNTDTPNTLTNQNADSATTTQGAETKAGVPDTGFTPADNKLIASLGVFIIGASLGGALGFGYIQLKKKRFNS